MSRAVSNSSSTTGQPVPGMASRLPDSVAASIAYHTQNPGAIDKRLARLDREWDLMQAATLVASGTSLFGLTAAIAGRRRWLLPIVLTQGILMWHVLRSRSRGPAWAGLRPRSEIEAERYALKALRGDFQNLPSTPEARGTSPVLEAVKR